jgi:hypothetical protein
MGYSAPRAVNCSVSQIRKHFKYELEKMSFNKSGMSFSIFPRLMLQFPLLAMANIVRLGKADVEQGAPHHSFKSATDHPTGITKVCARFDTQGRPVGIIYSRAEEGKNPE